MISKKKKLEKKKSKKEELKINVKALEEMVEANTFEKSLTRSLQMKSSRDSRSLKRDSIKLSSSNVEDTESKIFSRNRNHKRSLSMSLKRSSKQYQNLSPKGDSFVEENNNQIQSLFKVIQEEETEEQKMEREKIRKGIALELLHTEETYVDQLDIVNEIIIKPLNETFSDNIAQELKFLNHLQVILSYNQVLLGNLKKSNEEWGDFVTGIGLIFNQITDFLKVYTSYCNEYSKSLEKLSDLMNNNEEFSEFISEKMKDPKIEQSMLTSYLILPVQRIPRYVTLIKQLLEQTLETDEDYESLNNAYNKMESVAQYLNNKKREVENIQQVLEVQKNIIGGEKIAISSHRRFIDEGSLLLVNPENSVEFKVVYVFLFSDIAIITKKKKSKKLKKKGGFKYIFLSSTDITYNTLLNVGFPPEIIKAPTIRGLYLENEGNNIIFGVNTEEELRQWIVLFDNAITKQISNIKARLTANSKSREAVYTLIKKGEKPQEEEEEEENINENESLLPKNIKKKKTRKISIHKTRTIRR